MDFVVVTFVFDEYVFSDFQTWRSVQTPRSDGDIFISLLLVKKAGPAELTESSSGKARRLIPFETLLDGEVQFIRRRMRACPNVTAHPSALTAMANRHSFQYSFHFKGNLAAFAFSGDQLESPITDPVFG